MQNQYEYKTFKIKSYDRLLEYTPTTKLLDEAINEFAEEGWEFHSVVQAYFGGKYPSRDFIAICRRPKTLSAPDTTPSEWLPELERFYAYLKYGHILGMNLGYGKETAFFDKAGYRYTSIEEERYIRKLTAKFPNHTFITSSLKKANFRFESFDGCWTTTLFAHTLPHSIVPALDTLKDALKNGAYCFFTICIGQEDYVDPDTRIHYYLYTENTAEDLLTNNGFKILHRGRVQRKKHDPFEVATYLVRLQK